MATLRRIAPLCLLLWLAPFLRAGPLTFEFTPAPSALEPLARELWADVATPSGRTLRLPAYFSGGESFAVRARPDEAGAYRLVGVHEGPDRATAPAIPFTPRSVVTVENRTPSPRAALGLDPVRPGAFRDAAGRPFVPVGTNLAWARSAEVTGYYRTAFAAFAAHDLNWTRIWLAHWGGLNPDWLPPAARPSPAPGGFDATVAARWDDVLAAAEEQGIYVQVVLQHHGQYSTTVNSNWPDNPWNAANPGGFLPAPEDFFTDPRARELTRRKYRTFVARCAWSPAVMAWELFNEVHWVDALKLRHDEAAVARWHDEMAGFLRSVDPYGHLVTTSTEDLRSPLYARMDYLQPHLYAAHLLAGARTFAPALGNESRPVFYGEFGDDHLPVDAAVKKSGLTEAPPIWAGLMGQGVLPAQPWEGWKLLETGRLGEIGAVARFLRESGWSDETGLAPFSAKVSTDARVPLVLPAGQHWQRRPGPDFTLPADGREPLELADWPAAFVTPASTAKDGFPDRAVVSVDFPRDTTVRLHVAEVAAQGGSLRVSVDGVVALERAWTDPAALPMELKVPVKAGQRRLTVENAGASDWVRLSGIDLGLDQPVLAALGRRNDRFIAVWVRHRANLFALDPIVPASGELVLADVPAGRWSVTWWDAVRGQPEATQDLAHAGGPLTLPTPPISRHAAVVLRRQQ